MVNMVVKEFDNENVLTTPRQNGTIELIDDIPDVVSVEKSSGVNTLSGVTVVAVTAFTSKRKCPACKQGTHPPVETKRWLRTV